MIIECKGGYRFDITYDGQRYLAICQNDGRCNTRQCEGVWLNDISRPVSDPDFIDCWEQGVRDWQAAHTSKPSPQRGRISARAPFVPAQRVVVKPRREGNRYE